MSIRIVKKAISKAGRTVLRMLIKIQQLCCKEILVLGDSHAGIFSKPKFRLSMPGYYLNVVSVVGATVSGLENPNSKTQAMPIFLEKLKSSKAKVIIVLIGEVDTGFVIWYRSEKYKVNVTDMLDEALNNYQKLLQGLLGTHQVICVSTPLPTIKDGQNWGEVANARKDIKATQLERTKLTLLFNERMKVFCLANGITYLDYDQESVGEDGLVDKQLLNTKAVDHHYEPGAYIDMILPKLKDTLSSAC